MKASPTTILSYTKCQLWLYLHSHVNLNRLTNSTFQTSPAACRPKPVIYTPFLWKHRMLQTSNIRQVQMRITFAEKCLLEATKATPCLPNTRTKTKAQTDDMLPTEYHVLIKMSSHINWDKAKSVFRAKESCRAKHHCSWMNGTLVTTFISCLKGWEICSWLTFCFPETGWFMEQWRASSHHRYLTPLL